MKVAHVCIVTPGRCGLYETARELVAGLRDLRVDSRLVDVPAANKVYPNGYLGSVDRGAIMADMGWAVQADVIVNHSGFDGTPLQGTNQPVIHVAHGRPRSSFLCESKGSTKIYTYHYNKNFDDRWKAVVTFWPEHSKFLKVMFPDKMVYDVPASVDLSYWSDGESDYDFHGNKGDINVICADPKRDDNDAFEAMSAFALWARTKVNAKLHLFGAPEDMAGYTPILTRISKDGNMGLIHRWSNKLREAYRAADFAITSSGIDTRSVREAMACGCPVVQLDPLLKGFERDFDDALVASRAETRELAVSRFNPVETARQFKRVLECSF